MDLLADFSDDDGPMQDRRGDLMDLREESKALSTELDAVAEGHVGRESNDAPQVDLLAEEPEARSAELQLDAVDEGHFGHGSNDAPQVRRLAEESEALSAELQLDAVVEGHVSHQSNDAPHIDLLADLSDEGTDIIDDPHATALVALPRNAPNADAHAGETSSQTLVHCADTGLPTRSKAYNMQGKVGRGRHGGLLERQLVCSHMRAEKRAKKMQDDTHALVEALNDCAFVKNGQSFTVAATHRGGGPQIVISKASSKGNRFVRKIHFSKFIRAAFGLNSSNVAIAALLNVDASTVPRLQKTCAGVFMMSQAKLLARLLSHCQRVHPVSVHKQLKWDETTVATTLNPGGRTHSVRSAWSVLVC